MKTSETIVKFDNVSFQYERKVTILENVNFKIKKLSSVCILGPNGGGKSTLLKLILGFVKPTSGKITICNSSPDKYRSKIGYMPQYHIFDSSFPIRVIDIVLMGKISNPWFCFYSSKEKKAAFEILDLLKLADLANQNFSDLSGGQRQRVLIARALVSNPKLLLLDEPTSNIDPEFEEQFFQILDKLSTHVTILTVSHDLGFVSKQYKDVLCVNRTVIKHPTSALTGDIISSIYHKDVRMVNHDKHSCKNHNTHTGNNHDKHTSNNHDKHSCEIGNKHA